MDKPNMIYPYDGILLSEKKVWSTESHDMVGPWKCYAN
jgi:hypothetical protein